MTKALGRGLLLLALAWSGAVVAAQSAQSAQSDNDLALIPPDSQAPPKLAQSRSGQSIYLEDASTAVSLRDDLPVPAPPSYDWQERLLLDARDSWEVGRITRLVLSDRLNLRAESDLPFPDKENIVNDLREAYLEWRLADQTYLAFGRINLKSGIALGYNPTDYFKARTVSEPLSADPTVLREDRLGTVMLRLQHVGRGGSFTLAFAPRLRRQSPIDSNTELPGFDPMLGRTNSDNRFLLKGSIDSADLSPEVLVYHDSHDTRVGLNLSMALGQSVVGYVEESLARRRDLIAQALDFGRATGTLPAAAPDEPPPSPGSSLKNELAVGASYTTPGRVTWNFEYHLDQAGFTSQDWNRWFAIGGAPAAPPAITNELWYIRSYALDQQEQSTEQAAFVRADWTDAFGLNLELSGFVDVDLRDGSGQAQGEIDYYLSDTWTLGLLAAGDFGSPRSDFGSLPTAYSILLSLRRYF
jgi:hypothetical protein